MFEGVSCKAFRCLAATLVIAATVAIAPATAQFPPAPDDPQDPVGTPKGKKAPPAAGPNVAGTWTRPTRPGREPQPPTSSRSPLPPGAAIPSIRTSIASESSPRVGSSKSYLFFIEVITKGQADKGGRCPDGTITVGRQGSDLAVGWFGSIQDSVVVAYGSLKKK